MKGVLYMSKSYNKYSTDFKKMIVSLVESGRRKSEVAREYGISEPNIRSWQLKYGKVISKDGQVTSNDEILKLKREIAQKDQEIEILKKVVAMFSQDQ